MDAFLRNLSVFLQARTWHDVADILLVAFLAYRLLLLIRGTRAVQLIAGLGVLVFIGFTARLLQLQLTYWIFSNLAPALLIGVVILFQPELRRALDRVGRLGMLGRPLAHYNLQLMARLVDEVAQGAGWLSERRIGALVAFERDVGIENHALTGVRVNGEVTAELLMTIFFPNSPLHDGAAIIRGTQLVAAGALLPLVDEMNFQGRLGTRHRAALGLSLESDAIVMVVSEETGRISLARDGKLQRGIDVEELRQVLRTALLPKAAQEGRRLFGRRPASTPPPPLSTSVMEPTLVPPLEDEAALDPDPGIAELVQPSGTSSS
ncbi:MAG: diadenylate cyclase CdaA [Candidatus Dormibacteria bacterium]